MVAVATRGKEPHVKSMSYSDLMRPDEDWRLLPDAAERRKIQNRLAQRAYRRNMRDRTKELEQLKRKLAKLQRGRHVDDGCSSSSDASDAGETPESDEAQAGTERRPRQQQTSEQVLRAQVPIAENSLPTQVQVPWTGTAVNSWPEAAVSPWQSLLPEDSVDSTFLGTPLQPASAATIKMSTTRHQTPLQQQDNTSMVPLQKMSKTAAPTAAVSVPARATRSTSSSARKKRLRRGSRTLRRTSANSLPVLDRRQSVPAIVNGNGSTPSPVMKAQPMSYAPPLVPPSSCEVEMPTVPAWADTSMERNVSYPSPPLAPAEQQQQQQEQQHIPFWSLPLPIVKEDSKAAGVTGIYPALGAASPPASTSVQTSSCLPTYPGPRPQKESDPELKTELPRHLQDPFLPLFPLQAQPQHPEPTAPDAYQAKAEAQAQAAAITTIHFAVATGSLSFLRQELHALRYRWDAPAELEARDAAGCTALQRAVMAGRPDMVSALLSAATDLVITSGAAQSKLSPFRGVRMAPIVVAARGAGGPGMSGGEG